MELDDNIQFEGLKKKNKTIIGGGGCNNESLNPYTYQEMLKMLYNAMDNDGLILENGTIKLNALIIGKEGSRTVIKDWSKFLNSINRNSIYLEKFISNELLTKIFFNEEKDKLYIKGRYSQSEIEIILKKYIKTYIICSSCKSLNTVFIKKDRVLFIKCNKCNCEKGLDKKI